MINKKIIIFGATGQIGKELSLKVKENKDGIDFLFYARTLVSASFFIENKINYIVGNLEDKMIIQNISEADLIFDLTAPNTGTLQEIKEIYKNRLDLIIGNMKKKSKFVFASTKMAFGLSEKRKYMKNYFFPGSIYAANKRYAEKYSLKLGKKNKIDIYLLRLADVHGDYQRSSENLKKLILNGYTFKIPKTPAWVIFISSIKKALIYILDNKEKPGLYTLTNDQIYWEDLLKYFADKSGSKIKIELMNNKKNGFFKNFKDFIYKTIISNKDLIRGNIVIPKKIEELKKLDFRVAKSKIALANLKGLKSYDELNSFVGLLPGKRMHSLDLKKNDT
tara:strand:+ start:1701 stop:2705 length:1005 start_codon:yes stop_codon:yes gene_type:complete